jgi:hypothetical protein
MRFIFHEFLGVSFSTATPGYANYPHNSLFWNLFSSEADYFPELP